MKEDKWLPWSTISTPNKNDSKQIQHVLHTSSHLNTVVKQHWDWKKLGWEFQILLAHIRKDTSFQTLFISIKSLRPAAKKIIW